MATRGSISIAPAPIPNVVYDAENEAQFRRFVEDTFRLLGAAVDFEIPEPPPPPEPTYQLIARKEYKPGSLTTYTTTSGTFADVDATNLAVTFDAPESGEVFVVLRGVSQLTAEASSQYGHLQHDWALRESTTTLSATELIAAIGAGKNGGASDRLTGGGFVSAVTPILSGLTGTKTYKWAHRFQQSDSAGSAALVTGPSIGAAIMEVWAVP
jgi:hypothetical protein